MYYVSYIPIHACTTSKVILISCINKKEGPYRQVGHLGKHDLDLVAK